MECPGSGEGKHVKSLGMSGHPPSGWSPGKGLTVEEGKPHPGRGSWQVWEQPARRPPGSHGSSLNFLPVALTPIFFSFLFEWFLNPSPLPLNLFPSQSRIIFSSPPEKIPQVSPTFSKFLVQAQRPPSRKASESCHSEIPFFSASISPSMQRANDRALESEGRASKSRKGEFFH